jgi:hypothetical protein
MVRSKKQPLAELSSQWLHLQADELQARAEAIVKHPTLMVANLHALGMLEVLPSVEAICTSRPAGTGTDGAGATVSDGAIHLRAEDGSGVGGGAAVSGGRSWLQQLLPLPIQKLVPTVIALARFQRDKDRTAENADDAAMELSMAVREIERALCTKELYLSSAKKLFRAFDEPVGEPVEGAKALRTMALAELPWTVVRRQEMSAAFAAAWLDAGFIHFLLGGSTIQYFQPPVSFFEAASEAAAARGSTSPDAPYALVRRLATDWSAVAPFLQDVEWFVNYTARVRSMRHRLYQELLEVFQASVHQRPPPHQVMQMRKRWVKGTGMGVASLLSVSRVPAERRQIRKLRETTRGVLHKPSSSVIKAVAKAFNQLSSISGMLRRTISVPPTLADAGAKREHRVKLLRSLLSQQQGQVLDRLLSGVRPVDIAKSCPSVPPPADLPSESLAQLISMRHADQGASLFLQFAYTVARGSKRRCCRRTFCLG